MTIGPRADRGQRRQDDPAIVSISAASDFSDRCSRSRSAVTFVMFNLTSRDAELLASLAGSLDHLVPVRKTSDPVPECVRDYASENVVHQVEPHAIASGPYRCRCV